MIRIGYFEFSSLSIILKSKVASKYPTHQRVAPVAARAHGQVAGLALGEEAGDEVAVLGQEVRGVVGADIFYEKGQRSIFICIDIVTI